MQRGMAIRRHEGFRASHHTAFRDPWFIPGTVTTRQVSPRIPITAESPLDRQNSRLSGEGIAVFFNERALAVTPATRTFGMC
jgi:hypothetical protein